MRAIATQQPWRFDCFFATANVANRRKYRRVGLRETDKFLFALNGNAKTLQVLDQNPFRFRLGETEDKRIRTRDRAHINSGDLFGSIVNAQSAKPQSSSENPVDNFHHLEDFECARKNSDRLRVCERSAALSMMRQCTPCRTSSLAIVRPTGPAPTTKRDCMMVARDGSVAAIYFSLAACFQIL